MTNNKFTIKIDAQDDASKTLANLQGHLGNLSKSLEPLNQKLAGGKGLSSSLGDIGEGLSSIGNSAASMASNLGKISAPLGKIGAATTVGGFVALEKSFADWGNALNRNSIMTGVSADDLQKLGGAAKLAGLDADTMTKSVSGLAMTLRNVKYGGDTRNGALLNLLGVDSDNPVKALREISDYLAAHPEISPSGKANMLSSLGIDPELLTLLDQGTQKMDEFSQSVENLGGVLGKDGLERAKELKTAFAGLEIAAQGAAYRMADAVRAPEILNQWSRWLSHPSGETYGAGALTAGAAAVGFGFGGPVGAAIAGGLMASGTGYAGGRRGPTIDSKMPARNGMAKESFDFWTSKGMTPAQAAGMVANEDRESGFNTGAVGDNGAARGIFQWHKDRRDKLLDQTGIDVWSEKDHQRQLWAANFEMTEGDETTAGKAIRGAGTAYDAGAIASRNYERPAASDAEANLRGNNATDWQAKLTQALADNTAATQAHTAALASSGRSQQPIYLPTARIYHDNLGSGGQ